MALSSGAAALAAQTAAAAAPIDLGSRREIFVDHFLIDRLTGGAALQLAQSVDQGTVHKFDQPWEGRFSGYATILREAPQRFHLYYRGVPTAGSDGRSAEVTCYASSTDGVHFTRPQPRNVILENTPPLQHNFSPFLDARPGVAEAERFKALAGTRKSGLVAFGSADGVKWRSMQEAPVLTEGAFDSQNLAFWSASEGRYVCYYRTFKKINGTGYRWVSRATSDDFLHWSKGEEMTFGDAPPEHLYTNQTSPYYRAPHIYMAVCARFLPGRQVLTEEEARAVNVDPGYFKDCSDAVLMSTRGGLKYDRPFLEAFLRPGLGVENWVSRSNYPALNIVETGPSEMSFYVVRNYGQPSIYLRRYTLRLDGFASVHAPYRGGAEMVTKPLRFSGARLLLNFATSAPGSVRVEIQDAATGAPIEGYAMADARELIGDQIERPATWSGKGADLSALAGRAVRLRFAMQDADLYALRFGA
ncbi:MAG: hypothetical protein FJW31_27545 [Acidobacteria bacterium]|nr:hypothetical protein [Acidobacteriota bacterium]